jgi:hypothetical protein
LTIERRKGGEGLEEMVLILVCCFKGERNGYSKLQKEAKEGGSYDNQA